MKVLYIPVSIISSTASNDTVHKEEMCLSGAPELKKKLMIIANVYVNK